MEKRDMKILDGIELHRYMNTDQVAELYFQTIKDSGQRRKKAAARLLKLYQHKLVNRTRYPGEPYIYFVRGGKYSHKIQHYMTITDVLLQLKSLLPAGARLTYDIEVSQGDLITDLVLRFVNEFRKERSTYWIEVELESTGDIVEKVMKYEDLEQEGTLVVVYKHSRTASRLKQEQFALPVQLLPLGDIKAQFKFGGVCFR
ncbi:MAG: hypothetical protein ABFD08_08185 [Syntrophomonas sp.]